MKIVIVGGGVAGITAAKTLAESDSQIKIDVFTDEKYPYYSKIRLPQLLAAKIKLADIYMYQPQWYRENKIEIHLETRVSKINPHKKEIAADGRVINYDKVLLATGSHPFVPPIKGLPKRGVFTFNSIDDALKIRDCADDAKKAIVIGGGVLGLESAAALKYLGLEVTVVEISPWLLPRQLDREGAKILKNKIEDLGIKVVLNSQTQEILGQSAVSGVLLNDGRRFSGELILISAGIRANLELKGDVRILADKGIVVNDFMETTMTDIYAAGDAAEHRGKIYGIIPPAIEQAKVAALNMLQEKSAVYNGTVPSNTLKVAGVSLTSIGLAQPGEPGYNELKLIDETRGIYKKIVIKDNRVVGTILLGERKDVGPLRRIISEKIDVSHVKDHLLKENFEIRSLLKTPGVS